MADVSQAREVSKQLPSDPTNDESSKDGQNAASPEKVKDADMEAPRKSIFDRAWAKVDIDMVTIMMMIKGSITPIVALAIFQADPVARHFGSLGYLIAIMGIIGFPIMPRGKFIQNMSLIVFGVCIGAAVNLLALYTAIKARQHTTPKGGSPVAYNSSASAVCGIWLFVQIYLINCLRVARPQFQFPCIIYSIFVSVAMTTGTQLPTMSAATSLISQLIEAFMTGFGLSTAVHFLVFPTSSRKVLLGEMKGYIGLMSATLQAESAYLQSLEDIEPSTVVKENEDTNTKKKGKSRKAPQEPGPLTTPAALKLKALMSKTIQLHTKIHGDLTPAKREFAIGKLESHDLTEIWRLLRAAFVPIIGLAVAMDIIQRRASDQEWATPGQTEEETAEKRSTLENLHFLCKQIHKSFAEITTDIELGMKHFLMAVELETPDKKKASDEEAAVDPLTPGSPTFVAAYRTKVLAFHKSREQTLASWAKEHGIELPPDFFAETFVQPEGWPKYNEEARAKNQRQLFFILYLEFMLWRASAAVLELITFAEKRKQDGVLSRNKLIFPGSKTLYKWLKATVGQEDLSHESHLVADFHGGGSTSIYLGAKFAQRKDPEHLPPRHLGEKIGEVIRLIPTFFRSDSSGFGFRVACATMSIAIICFLHDSQAWFLRQRILWAMIMVALSMTRTAGQSTFTFSLRILGTVIAMIGAYIIWYIVVGHTAGVLVFTWLWITGCFYFVIKTPKLTIVAILGMVTTVLILGYELQVQKLGVKVAEANGQPAYKTYILAPYRLASVTAGLAVAYIWTLFPFPVSEGTEMRRDLGAALYLTSNFYSIVHETFLSRVNGNDADAHIKGTHAYNLDKARNAVFAKLMVVIQSLSMNASFSKFQLRVGGRFPREEYEGLIETCLRVVQYTALVGYASTTISMHDELSHPTGSSRDVSKWSSDFRKLLSSKAPTTHRITSILALLSSSLSNAQPLPPYLEMPKPFEMTESINEIDPDLLSTRHIAEPEYSAYAVVQICSRFIEADVEKIYRHVKALVGEMDFTFHAIATSDGGPNSSSSSTLNEKFNKDD